MVKVRKGVDLKEFEKFGFVENSNNQYVYIRKIGHKVVYRAYITPKSKYLMIDVFAPAQIAGRLQTLIYDLTIAGLIEKEED